MNDLVSVIIPIYKVEQLLERCLESVINQSYSNLEIILVDDGSPDNCGKICDIYASKDNRIVVIHKKNGGLSSARNTGIEKARGKYICFIDSDDMIDQNYVKTLYTNLINFDCEISICGYKFINEYEHPKNEELCTNSKVKVYDSKEALKLMLYQKKINNSAWGKLYLTSFFDNIRYPEGKVYEDIPTTYKTFLKSKKICVDESKYYFYTKREESISGSFNEKTLDILDNVCIMEEELGKNSYFKKACNSRVLNADFFIIRQINKNQYSNIYHKLYQDIKKRRLSVLLDINSRFKTKIGILISYFGINFLKIVYSKNSNRSIIKKLD